MYDFVHLHVHSQYSVLDGQAAVTKLVDKAIKNGMRGIALTDHGNMFGVKEFWNYVGKKNDGKHKTIKGLQSLLKEMMALQLENPDLEAYLQLKQQELEKMKEEIGKQKSPSLDDTDALNKAAAHVAQVEKMKAEFSFDPVGAREKILQLEQIPDFKCIIGCEVYVARRGMLQKTTKEDQSGYHLILLAKNQQGYKNLIKIVSKAWTDGFYMRPRTDHEQLKKYHEGIICLSACLGGEIPKLITQERLEEAEKAILWHKSIFGDDYYLELQLHKATVERANKEVYGMQLKVNRHLVELAQKHNIKLVCTNDVHFVDEDDAEAHDRLICLSTGRDLDDPNRMLYSKQEWMKTREEMNEIFAAYPDAIENTVEVCNKVEPYSINHDPIMPMFAIPEEFGTEEEYRSRITEEDLFNEFTRDEHGNVVMSEEDAQKKIKKLGGYDKLYRIKLEADYLAKLAMDGAKERYGDPLTDEMKERLLFELHIMKTMGFPGYFLIVQDFINAARKELDVWVGPGRGSAAGSAVAYCLGITQVDPVKYDLLFERFLNPDRISLPDIDIDFEDEGRGLVLNWVTKKYGAEKVAHIITYGTMATKMAIKDVARVEKLPLSESDRLCKLIPDRLPDPKNPDKLLKINLTNVLANVKDFQEAQNSDNPLLRETLHYARKLEGNVRGTGVHACGTIICRDDITDWVPVSTADDKTTGEKMLVTQYEGSLIEDTGLIKMDFLGLKNLTIMKCAIRNIKDNTGEEVNIDTIPIDDELTYQLYQKGQTIGTFQFESDGMQNYLRQLHPTVFEDLIAMNALYRPGPMDYIPDFIDRKQGRKPIVYDIPVMERYLKDTYGITVYQEQVMLLSRLLADFTRGESDTLRKAMGKKLKDKLDALKPKFIKGGVKNGHDKEVLEKIWADWEKFASYAFNKSHATCYSWVAYQTAYLKAHYPSEYMAALLTSNQNDIKTLTDYMGECKKMGLNVLGPDINESMATFYASKNGDIRFGLAGIKGVGEEAVKSIIEERTKRGPFKNIADFFERVDYSKVNRKCCESCAYAGAFDSLIDFPRSCFFANPDPNDTTTQFLDMFLRYGQRVVAEKMNAQMSLFGAISGVVDIQPPVPPKADTWNNLHLLNMEKSVIGLYLSSHPLDEYKLITDKICLGRKLTDLADLTQLNGKEVSVCGVITSVEHKTTMKGQNFGVMKVEDYSGEREFTLWRKDYEQMRPFMCKDYYVLIRGRVQPRPYGENAPLEFKINSIQQLWETMESIKEVRLKVPVEKVTRDFIAAFQNAVKAAKGKTTLKLTLMDKQEGVILNLFSKKYKVTLNGQFAKFIQDYELDYDIGAKQ